MASDKPMPYAQKTSPCMTSTAISGIAYTVRPSPLPPALDGIIEGSRGPWSVFQIARDHPCAIPCYGSLRLYMHGGHRFFPLPYRLRTALEESKRLLRTLKLGNCRAPSRPGMISAPPTSLPAGCQRVRAQLDVVRLDVRGGGIV
jgi:hypothetical protein